MCLLVTLDTLATSASTDFSTSSDCCERVFRSSTGNCCILKEGSGSRSAISTHTRGVVSELSAALIFIVRLFEMVVWRTELAGFFRDFTGDDSNRNVNRG